MITIAVAGGTGNLGRAIVDVLVAEGEYRVLVFSRSKTILARGEKLSSSLVVVDYENLEDLTKKLESNEVHTLISTVSAMAGPGPELSLIDAAERSATTKRFVPSIWGIKCTSTLAEFFPSAQQKLAALDALEKTSLEYTSFLNGYFIDCFLAPHIKTYMSPMAIAVDIANKSAAIPGSGNIPVVFSYSLDIARYVAAALSLPRWERESYIVGDKVTWNQFLHFAEEARGVKFNVTYDSIEDLRSGKVSELPSHCLIYPFFPKDQLQGLLSSFGLMFEQGHFNLRPVQTLNERFPDIKTKTVREQIMEAWQGK